MTLFSEGFRPELPESSLFPSSFGASLVVDAEPGAANTPVDVIMFVTEVPPLTNTTVLTTTWVMLLAGLVEPEDRGPGMVEAAAEEATVSVTLSICPVDTVCRPAFEVLLDTNVEEGSPGSVGDADVDTASGVLEVIRDDFGVSLAGIEDTMASEASEKMEADKTDVRLAEAPVPLGTSCLYRSAFSNFSADTIDSDARNHSSVLLEARTRFILSRTVIVIS